MNIEITHLFYFESNNVNETIVTSIQLHLHEIYITWSKYVWLFVATV